MINFGWCLLNFAKEQSFNRLTKSGASEDKTNTSSTEATEPCRILKYTEILSNIKDLYIAVRRKACYKG